MAVVDLRGRNQEQALQRMMYIQNFQRQSGISGNEPSNVERVMGEIEDQDLKERQYGRQLMESEQRIRLSEEEHNRKLDEFQQQHDLRQREQDMGDWYKTETVKRGLEAQDINRQELEAKKPMYEAQTGEARARTGLVHEQTRGAEQERLRHTNEALVTDANWRRSAIIARSQREPLTADDADELEAAERVVGANPHYTLPRKPDGTPLATPQDLAKTVLDKDGKPSADFAKGLRDVEKPYNEFSQLIQDAKDAKAAGADPETMKHFTDKIRRESSPTSLGMVDAQIAQQLLDEGNIDGYLDFTNARSRASAPQIKIPDPRERIDYKGTLKMKANLDDIQNMYADLLEKNKFPAGYLKQPLWDMLQRVGREDKDIQVFRKKLEQFRQRYTLFLSGRATTPEERDDIKKNIPSLFDSFQTLAPALLDFNQGLQEDAAIDMGMAKSLGQAIPANVPVLEPSDVLSRDGKLPNFLLEKGAYFSGDAAANHVRGVQKIGRGLSAQGVGGLPGNARQGWDPKSWRKGGGEAEQQGESVEFDPSQYSDPEEAKKLQDQIDQLQAAFPGAQVTQ